jgi:hypothetical protein
VRRPQPLPAVESIQATPAESRAAPVGFDNASPFRQGWKSRDRVQLAIYAVAAIAGLTFLASMIALLIMRSP